MRAESEGVMATKVVVAIDRKPGHLAGLSMAKLDPQINFSCAGAKSRNTV